MFRPFSLLTSHLSGVHPRRLSLSTPLLPPLRPLFLPMFPFFTLEFAFTLIALRLKNSCLQYLRFIRGLPALPGGGGGGRCSSLNDAEMH